MLAYFHNTTHGTHSACWVMVLFSDPPTQTSSVCPIGIIFVVPGTSFQHISYDAPCDHCYQVVAISQNSVIVSWVVLLPQVVGLCLMCVWSGSALVTWYILINVEEDFKKSTAYVYHLCLNVHYFWNLIHIKNNLLSPSWLQNVLSLVQEVKILL